MLLTSFGYSAQRFAFVLLLLCFSEALDAVTDSRFGTHSHAAPHQVTGFLAAITILVCVADYVLAEMGGEKVSCSCFPTWFEGVDGFGETVFAEPRSYCLNRNTHFLQS